MTSKEFVLWLKGFTEGVHQYSITPLQWDLVKDRLAEVKDEQPIGVGGMGVPNTQPFPRWQEPHIFNVPNLTPNGTAPSPGFVITTSPGTTITTTPGTTFTTTPNGIFGIPNGISTSTTYGYPSGSAWNYTSSEKESTQTSERQLLTDNID